MHGIRAEGVRPYPFESDAALSIFVWLSVAIMSTVSTRAGLTGLITADRDTVEMQQRHRGSTAEAGYLIRNGFLGGGFDVDTK